MSLASTVPLFLTIFIHFFWVHWFFIAVRGLYLAVVGGGYPLVVGLRLLSAVASLVAEHGLSS